jgi:DnaK suppressor protein
MARKLKVLTEAQLLDMPDRDYMNPAQLAFFQQRLEDIRKQLLENAATTTSLLKENESTADTSDRATIEEENLIEQRVRDRERKLLLKVNAALQRISNGQYGYCLETGEPIGLERLLARPTAEYTLEAQIRKEKIARTHA